MSSSNTMGPWKKQNRSFINILRILFTGRANNITSAQVVKQFEPAIFTWRLARFLGNTTNLTKNAGIVFCLDEFNGKWR